jgi:L-lactate dehydrogenase complex protein LldG
LGNYGKIIHLNLRRGMNSREKILKRLNQVGINNNKVSLPVIKDCEIFTNIVQSKNELANLFSKKMEELRGEVFKVNSVPGAALVLKRIIGDFPEKSVLIQTEFLIDQVLKENKDILKYIDVNAQLTMASTLFASYQAGITTADYLVARTGSIIINCKTAGGRRLSVLPPVHIVIAKTDQIVSSLDTVLHKLNEADLDISYMTIITGPSRTSDIEKQLVLGAHGPKRLVVILLDMEKGILGSRD